RYGLVVRIGDGAADPPDLLELEPHRRVAAGEVRTHELTDAALARRGLGPDLVRRASEREGRDAIGPGRSAALRAAQGRGADPESGHRPVAAGGDHRELGLRRRAERWQDDRRRARAGG